MSNVWVTQWSSEFQTKHLDNPTQHIQLILEAQAGSTPHLPLSLSHGPGISNILGSSIQLRLYLYQWPLWASHSAISFSPWHLLSWGLYCNWGCANNGLSWPLTEPTLSWSSSILQLSCWPKQYNIRDFYTPRSVSSLRYSTDPLWITASVSQP